MAIIAIKPRTVPKTCARCGQGFEATGREYCCPDCKKPKRSVIQNLGLTSRERQVIELIKQAKTNKEVAQDLLLSEGTVKEYLVRIFKKLRVKNRTDLALWAAVNLAA